MKIANAVVGMESSHQNLSVNYSSLRLGTRMKKSDWEASQLPSSEEPDTVQSQEATSYGNGIRPELGRKKLSFLEKKAQKDAPENGERKQRESKEEGGPAVMVDLSKEGVDASKSISIQAPEKEEEPVCDKTMSTLRALLHFLKSISKNPKAFEKIEEYLDSQEGIAKGVKNGGNNAMLQGFAGAGKSFSKEPTVLVDRRETFSAESEYTSFSAAGIAKTEDGRELSFNVDFEMSRSFMQYTKTEQLYKPEPIINVCDPLVINVGADVAKVSDQKFSFDLDSDGKADQISMLGEGSGFLALDKDEDGKIKDGTELFGAKSGNGFRDLSEYDEDQNGWIDENDAVFDKLKIWYRHEDGTDRLISLKEADVGAIHLGNASTEFSLKSAEKHSQNGVVRNTGVFLRESGGAGTIQHVDLAL